MTTTITTRASKGARLSFTEMDANFTNLKATADAAAVQATTYLKSEVDSALATKQAALGFTPYNSTNPLGFISANQSITVSGDVAGNGTTSLPLTLTASGVTAGSVGSSTAIPVITFDAKGRAIAASSAVVIAPAGTLTGTVLASNVIASSLTSVGTLSALTVIAVSETKVAMPANDVDLSTGTYFTKTISGAATLTASRVATSGAVSSFVLDLTNAGSAAITWFAGTKWAGGSAPVLTAAGRDILGFYSYDAGVTWAGLVLGKDVK